MRREIFANEEYYHIYNRGVEKRNIFCDENDFQRFLQSLEEFNLLDPTGGIYANAFQKNKTLLRGSTSKSEKLVDVVAYCLNPNHFHLILKQATDRGVEKLMHRLGTGYTMYFNTKYQRSGSLFQGRFKAKHIDTNEYLLHTSVYVNLNYRVHQLRGSTSKSSWEEYLAGESRMVKARCILDQFSSIKEYQDFSERTVEGILERRVMTDEF